MIPAALPGRGRASPSQKKVDAGKNHGSPEDRGGAAAAQDLDREIGAGLPADRLSPYGRHKAKLDLVKSRLSSVQSQ